ncbi:MAG: YlzJ-like family protein [Caldicoprobacterales bacterium]|jgi:hypothetical protein|nr:hypothetical protein [Clostridiales bacterium]
MILHTIVNPEQVWAEHSQAIEIQETEYKGVRLEVLKRDEETVVINRIISTDLHDYLNPNLQPGTIIEYTWRSRE